MRTAMQNYLIPLIKYRSRALRATLLLSILLTSIGCLVPPSQPDYYKKQISTPSQFVESNKQQLASISRLPDREPQRTPPPPSPTAVTQIAISNTANQSKIHKRWALIVGLSKYEYSGKGGLTELAFADDDAIDFSNTLKEMGWASDQIKLLINEQATSRNVRTALDGWLSKADADDMIILYWSGHGYPDPGDHEKVYFACYDTDTRDPSTGFRMDRVRDSLEEHNARNVILIADTCHAGKLVTRGDTQSDRALGVMPAITKLERQKDIPKGWIFMVSAESDRKAIEHSSWSNGAFTYCLIKGLRGEADGYRSAGKKDGVVTMGELREYLNTFMPEETQRILRSSMRPLITTSTGNADIWDLNLNQE